MTKSRTACSTIAVLAAIGACRVLAPCAAAADRTEVLGVFNYGPGIKDGDVRPMFDVDGGSFTVAGLREITFGKHCWFVKVRERRGGETRTLGSDKEGGWIGWALYSGWKPALVSAGAVDSAAALVAAVRDGAEGATIEVAAGTYELDAPLEPKAGMTLRGAGIDKTIITQAAGWKPSTRTLPDPEMKTDGMDTRAYLVRLKDRAAGVTISDLTLRGPRVHGAIYGWENKDLHVHHVRVQDVLWAGIRRVAGP